MYVLVCAQCNRHHTSQAHLSSKSELFGGIVIGKDDSLGCHNISFSPTISAFTLHFTQKSSRGTSRQEVLRFFE
jgi:hypothetical protein